MNKRALFSIALSFLSFSALGQQGVEPLTKLQALNAEESAAPLSLKARERIFSALGALPADTDSFIAVNKLGALAGMVQAQVSPVPGMELGGELDSFAVGITSRTVQDLQRLQPLFQVLSAAQDEVAATWGARADADAARAIVAVQREQKSADGAKLVQATKDFHLAPIYMVLTARPGGEMLLQQLSVLPLMVPMGTDAPIEMTVRSGWRGFCVHGSMLDLSAAELAPEHENQIQINLQKARLYVLARTVGNKLVLVICSNPDEVRIPTKSADSALATPQIAAFDSVLPRKAWAVGYSSPAVVKLREELDMFDYQYVATFMERVFLRLAGENEACATAAAAVKSLLNAATQFLPSQQGAERVAVWEEDALYIHLAGSAGTQRFTPAALRYSACANASSTVFYAESTPVAGTPQLDIPALLNDVEAVQRGYTATLQPGPAREMEASMQRLQHYRPAMEQLGTGFQKWHSALAGSGTLLLQEAAADAPLAFEFSFRGEFADEASAAGTANRLRSGFAAATPGTSLCPTVETTGNTVLVSYGAPSLGMAAPDSSVQVPGGALFSLNLPALVRMLERMDPQGQDAYVQGALEKAREAAVWLERVDAAACTSGNELHALIRIQPPGKMTGR